jgi:hypothetical protein
MLFTPFSFIKSAAAAPSGWTPADFANITYWWYSDFGISQTSNEVQSWTDYMAGAVLPKATGTGMTYNAADSQFNNKPSVYQSRTLATLIEYTLFPGWNNNDDRTIFFVGQPEQVSAGSYNMWGGVTSTGGAASEQVPYVQSDTVPDKIGTYFFPNGKRSTNTTTPYNVLGWQGVAYDSSVGTAYQYYNSTTPIGTDTGLTINPVKQYGFPFEIGGYGNSSGFNFKGYILEAIIIKGLPSSAELIEFDNYVTSTYS